VVRRTLLRRLNLLFLALAAPAAAAVPLVELTADPVPLTTVALKRGSLPVRVSLGFDKAMLLNLAPAQQLGLKPFPIIGKFKVKNPQIPGGEAIIRGNLLKVDVGGTGRHTVPTAWIDKDVVDPPHAGVVSILAFDADRVRVTVPGAPAGGRLYALPRAGKGDAEVKWVLGRDTIRVIFDFTSEVSVANARAAAVLEREGLVRRSSRVGLWSPLPALKLPVELLRPVAGANLMGLPLQQPVARITPARARELDARAAAGITGDSADDPDAIVVTAETKKSGGPPWMLIGRDVLRHCATVELDRPGARWLMTCSFPGG
jgi:hypothetical protein